MLTVPMQNYINCLSLALGLNCGTRYPVTSDIPPKNKFKKNTLQITFGILNSEDDYIDMPNLIKIVKLTKNVKK